MNAPNNDIATHRAGTFSQEREFEKLYLVSREKEHRLYSDEQVSNLPSIHSNHIHSNEWKIRARSADRLINYLRHKKRHLSILEVGCGNGWLAARLAAMENSAVTGFDINKTELTQAVRVFGNRKNLVFRHQISEDDKFDIVVFAASIQYFSSFHQTIHDYLELLNGSGEVHILDSFFYRPEEVTTAKQRSLAHYRSMGNEQLSAFYHHHSIVELHGFRYKILFNPSSILNKPFIKKDPFPWISIYQE